MDPGGDMAQQNQSGNACAQTCDTGNHENAAPECGLQPSKDDITRSDAPCSKADHNRRGWRSIVRNFTPS